MIVRALILFYLGTGFAFTTPSSIVSPEESYQLIASMLDQIENSGKFLENSNAVKLVFQELIDFEKGKLQDLGISEEEINRNVRRIYESSKLGYSNESEKLLTDLRKKIQDHLKNLADPKFQMMMDEYLSVRNELLCPKMETSVDINDCDVRLVVYIEKLVQIQIDNLQLLGITEEEASSKMRNIRSHYLNTSWSASLYYTQLMTNYAVLVLIYELILIKTHPEFLSKTSQLNTILVENIKILIKKIKYLQRQQSGIFSVFHSGYRFFVDKKSFSPASKVIYGLIILPFLVSASFIHIHYQILFGFFNPLKNQFLFNLTLPDFIAKMGFDSTDGLTIRKLQKLVDAIAKLPDAEPLESSCARLFE